MARDNALSTELIIVMIILFAVIAFLVPNIFATQSGPSNMTIDQSEREVTVLTSGLEAVLINTNSSNNEADLTLVDSQSGESVSINGLQVGQETTKQLNGENITVTHRQVLSGASSIISYQYPTYYGWPSGAKELLQATVSILVFLFVAWLYYIAKGESV